MRVNNLWETWGVEAVGCSSAAFLSVSVYIWGGGNRQLRRRMPPFKAEMQQLFRGDTGNRNRSEFISSSDSVQVTFDLSITHNYMCVQYACVWSRVRRPGARVKNLNASGVKRLRGLQELCCLYTKCNVYV